MRRTLRLLGMLVIATLIGCGGGKNQSDSQAKAKHQQPDKKSAEKNSQSGTPKTDSSQQQSSTTRKKATAPKVQTDLTVFRYASKDTATMIIVRPSKIVAHPLFALLPTETIGRLIPVDAEQLSGIVQATIFAPAAKIQGSDEMPHFAVLVDFRSAEAWANFRASIEKGKKTDEGGKVVYPAPGARGGEAIAHIVNEKRLILGYTDVVRDMLAMSSAITSTARHLQELDDGGELVVVTNLVAHKGPIELGLKLVQSEIPPGIQKLADSVKDAETVGLRVNLSSDSLLTISLKNTSATAAKGLHGLTQLALAEAQKTYKKFEGLMKKSTPKNMVGLVDVAASAVNGVKATLNETEVAVTIHKPDGFDTLSDLLRPSIEAARARTRELRKANNLKSIGLAVQIYYDSYKKLPANVLDKDGKPLLSWRVHLLPYIGADQIKLKSDEPWNSAHNLKAVKQMPPVFGSNKEGKTSILSFAGKRPQVFADVKDGTSKTLFAVLVDDDHGVPWTKPDDLQPDAKAVLNAVKNIRSDRILTLFYSGRMLALPKNISESQLKELIDYADGLPKPATKGGGKSFRGKKKTADKK